MLAALNIYLVRVVRSIFIRGSDGVGLLGRDGRIRGGCQDIVHIN